MSEEDVLRLLLALIVPLTGVLTFFLNRKHKNSVETRDSTASAMSAVTESAHVMVDLMAEAMKPLKERLDDQQTSIDHLEFKTKALDKVVYSLAQYAKKLRKQIVDLGHEPISFPQDLEHLLEHEPEPLPKEHLNE